MSAVDEETLTSSYQRTEQQGFDPTPEPPLNRLAELPDDGEWAADCRTQTVPMPLPLNSLSKYINTC